MLNELTDFKDPFNKGSVASFSIFGYAPRFSFDKGWSYHGSVKFKNGDTEGEQKFEARSLKELSEKMDIFMEGLK